ncbi:MAG: PepSY-like domain-containing protein [Flavobacterium sp.]|nr:PepSY-like domain-containing protein [Candidatus Neoflavobacterium equi]
MKTQNFLILLVSLFSLSTFAQKKNITQNQLPAKAQTFINTYFKNVPLSYATEKKEYYIVNEYKVKLQNGVEIEFDSSGDWKEVDGNHTALPSGFLPKKITTYIAKSFPKNKVIKAEVKRWKYEIEITNGLDLEFNKSGDFIKID